MRVAARCGQNMLGIYFLGILLWVVDACNWFLVTFIRFCFSFCCSADMHLEGYWVQLMQLSVGC